MTTPYQYNTLSEAVNGLRDRGYEQDMLKLISETNNPKVFTITEVYRFEGMSNPGDNSVLFAIESDKGQKGVVIDAYGSDADTKKTELLSQIKIKEV